VSTTACKRLFAVSATHHGNICKTNTAGDGRAAAIEAMEDIQGFDGLQREV
jgi:hypothetical protein